MTDVAKRTEFGDDSEGIRWWCPGCNQHHAVPTGQTVPMTSEAQ